MASEFTTDSWAFPNSGAFWRRDSAAWRRSLTGYFLGRLWVSSHAAMSFFRPTYLGLTSTDDSTGGTSNARVQADRLGRFAAGCKSPPAAKAPIRWARRVGPYRYFSSQDTSQYWPNLRPTSRKTPMRLKPNDSWSAIELALGRVTPARTRWTSSAASASKRVW